MARKKPLVLKVSPDIEHDPKTKLDDRRPLTAGHLQIEWRKDKDSDADFDFIGFMPATVLLASGGLAQNPFKNISVKKTRIKCDFEPEQSEGDPVRYAYTIAIEHAGVAYNTDEEEDPDHGKAVIRN